MELLIQLTPYLFDWLDLLTRWIHIIVGITWIGTSFYFNWLDSRLDRNINKEGIEGELWSVHAGGFYNVSKLDGPPKQFPKELHWFKWEAYTTWISGFVLLIIVYYLNAETLMIDKSINDISPLTAVVISVLFLLGSWLLYDFLCKSPLKEYTEIFTIVGFFIAIIICFFLTKIYGSRAAYIHAGACLGTIMAANVFRVIIPSQKDMVNAALSGKAPDVNKSISAKTRSLHNNYITLPVLFIMISSHYPFTYGHKYNWIILAVISLIGAGIRHYFNLRNKKQHNVWILPVATMGIVFLMLYTSLPKVQNISEFSNEKISFVEVNHIIQIRCASCHATNPTFMGVAVPPLGIIYDSKQDILNNLNNIKAQAVDSNAMPPGNVTGITKEERKKLALWIQQNN